MGSHAARDIYLIATADNAPAEADLYDERKKRCLREKAKSFATEKAFWKLFFSQPFKMKCFLS
jgi:hypothetical protein